MYKRLSEIFAKLLFEKCMRQKRDYPTGVKLDEYFYLTILDTQYCLVFLTTVRFLSQVPF